MTEMHKEVLKKMFKLNKKNIQEGTKNKLPLYVLFNFRKFYLKKINRQKG